MAGGVGVGMKVIHTIIEERTDLGAEQYLRDQFLKGVTFKQGWKNKTTGVGEGCGETETVIAGENVK